MNQGRTPKQTGKFGVKKGFESKKAERKDGEIMIIGKEPITVYATTSVIKVANMMLENDCRRIPIVDAGTKVILGVAKAVDIVDFLGGGEKYNIILNNFNGNFLSAINSPIAKIASQNFMTMTNYDSIKDAVNIMIEKHTSLIPVTDEYGKILKVVTEKDVFPTLKKSGVKVGDIMQRVITTVTPRTTIKDLARIIVNTKKRRIPVVSGGELVGIISVMDVLKFLKEGEFKNVMSEDVLSETVDKIMKQPTVVFSDTDLDSIVTKMKETNFGGFPVIEDGKLVGIITTTDVIKAFYGK
ncbi:MAG: CBS domain-containing protein [Candidatus Altarchaeum sp.]|nr:CBS domain-containing protein [Candidatus Altarchaeum sp.]